MGRMVAKIGSNNFQEESDLDEISNEKDWNLQKRERLLTCHRKKLAFIWQ